MPATPGTSARYVIDPSVSGQSAANRSIRTPSNPIRSTTHDPFFGIEAGRTVPS